MRINLSPSTRSVPRAWLVLLALLAVAPAPAAAQKATRSRADLIGVARRIMEAAHFATLVTVDSTGAPQARIMDAFPPDSQIVVWLGTNPRTRKVAQIRRDPRVAISYFDPQALAYVTVLGRARLVDDPAEKQRRFKPAWARMYPDRDRDYLLIRVTPERFELLSVRDGVMVDSLTWRTPAVRF